MDEELVMVRQTGGSRERRRAAWGRVLERWRESGLRATEFCRRHEIKPKRFSQWRAKLQRLSRAPASGGFAEVEVSGACPGIEIHLGLAKVLLPFDGDAQRLSMILQAVREASC